MAAQRHIGLVIFSVCAVLAARVTFFEPEPREPTPAEKRWAAPPRVRDPLKLVHDLRFYFYAVGALGLLIYAQDQLAENRRRRASRAAGPRKLAAETPAPPEPPDPGRA